MSLHSVHGKPFERYGRLFDHHLSRAVFVDRFHIATDRCLDIAAQCVTDDLPHELVYRATWSVFNGAGLYEDEEVFGDNTSHTVPGHFDAASILDVIWQYERFPRWIHIAVDAIDENHTVVMLMFSCCFCKNHDPNHPNDIYPFFVKCPTAPTDEWRWGSPRFSLMDRRRHPISERFS